MFRRKPGTFAGNKRLPFGVFISAGSNLFIMRACLRILLKGVYPCPSGRVSGGDWKSRYQGVLVRHIKDTRGIREVDGLGPNPSAFVSIRIQYSSK
jgi:hypothetical protein